MLRSTLLALLHCGWTQDPPPKLVLDLGGGVTMEFVEIKAGKFTMGADEPGERPEHEVTISKNFWMQTTEVTQAQWKAVMGTDPAEFKGAELPVETVSWDDCADFTVKFGSKVQGQHKGRKASLPTEAQWEYACRAGSKSRWSFGDDDKQAGQYCWHEENSERKTHPVSTKKPNAWGLYDMHGNVWEWCADVYAEAYPSGPETDPRGPAEGDGRIRRGGGWGYAPGALQSSTRDRSSSSYRCNYIGFRTVLR